MILDDLVSILAKFGFENIEKNERKESIELQIKSCKDKARKSLLEKTLYVFRINAIVRDDKKKVLSCEVCRQMTNTLVKLFKNSKDSCPDCMGKELGAFVKVEDNKVFKKKDIEACIEKPKIISKVKREKVKNEDNK